MVHAEQQPKHRDVAQPRHLDVVAELGLTQEAELGNHIKVPGLGDIPVLGLLFGVDHTSKSKTELYVVVTPHVMRTSDHHEAPKPPK